MDNHFDRRTLAGLLGALTCAVPLRALGRDGRARRVRRIGFLAGSESSLVSAFKEELARLGYVDGAGLVVETRPSRTNTSDASEQAAELAGLGLELIVAASLALALEVRRASPDMPMVIATCPGMVSNGFAESLAHPGGHVTGIDELPPGITGKRLALLKAAAPNVSRVALLSTTPGHGGHETQLADAEAAAARLGVDVRSYRVSSFSELEPALAALAQDGMNGLVNFQGGLSLVNRQLIVEFATRRRLPAIYQATLFPEAGGLMAWAPDLNEQFRVAARYVDRILKGARPGDLPIQYPARYYLTINMTAAKSIGLAFPSPLLAEADKVLP